MLSELLLTVRYSSYNTGTRGIVGYKYLVAIAIYSTT